MVPGPLLQVLLATWLWALGTPHQPWCSSPSSAAAAINTKVFESLSSVWYFWGAGAGVWEPSCPMVLLGAC